MLKIKAENLKVGNNIDGKFLVTDIFLNGLGIQVVTVRKSRKIMFNYNFEDRVRIEESQKERRRRHFASTFNLKQVSDGVRMSNKGQDVTITVSLDQANAYLSEGMAIWQNGRYRMLYTIDEIRDYIKKRDKRSCAYCRKKGDTIDHIQPKAKGGLTTFSNLACACTKCNQSKADQDVSLYKVLAFV